MLSSLGQTGLVAKILASALALTSWPQPRAFGLGLALVLLTWPQKMCYPMQNNIGCSHSWLYHCKICNLHYKDVVRHSNVGQKFIYTLLTLSPCVLIHKCLHVAGLDLSLSLEDLAFVSASSLWSGLSLRVLALTFWPH